MKKNKTHTASEGDVDSVGVSFVKLTWLIRTRVDVHTDHFACSGAWKQTRKEKTVPLSGDEEKSNILQYQ